MWFCDSQKKTKLKRQTHTNTILNFFRNINLSANYDSVVLILFIALLLPPPSFSFRIASISTNTHMRERLVLLYAICHAPSINSRNTFSSFFTNAERAHPKLWWKRESGKNQTRAAYKRAHNRIELVEILGMSALRMCVIQQTEDAQENKNVINTDAAKLIGSWRADVYFIIQINRFLSLLRFTQSFLFRKCWK